MTDFPDSCGRRTRPHVPGQAAARASGCASASRRPAARAIAYVVNYADEVGAGDVVFEAAGVKVIVDADSLQLRRRHRDRLRARRASTRPSGSAIRTSRASAAAARASTSNCPSRLNFLGRRAPAAGILRRSIFEVGPARTRACAGPRVSGHRFTSRRGLRAPSRGFAWPSNAPCPSSSPMESGRTSSARSTAASRQAGLRIVAARMHAPVAGRGRGLLRACTASVRSSRTSCAYMTSGPVIVQVLEGENAVAKNREIMGATDPKKAAPGTIRADLADSIEAERRARLRQPRERRARDRVLLRRDGALPALSAGTLRTAAVQVRSWVKSPPPRRTCSA